MKALHRREIPLAFYSPPRLFVWRDLESNEAVYRVSLDFGFLRLFDACRLGCLGAFSIPIPRREAHPSLSSPTRMASALSDHRGCCEASREKTTMVDARKSVNLQDSDLLECLDDDVAVVTLSRRSERGFPKAGLSSRSIARARGRTANRGRLPAIALRVLFPSTEARI